MHSVCICIYMYIHVYVHVHYYANVNWILSSYKINSHDQKSKNCPLYCDTFPITVINWGEGVCIFWSGRPQMVHILLGHLFGRSDNSISVAMIMTLAVGDNTWCWGKNKMRQKCQGSSFKNFTTCTCTYILCSYTCMYMYVHTCTSVI